MKKRLLFWILLVGFLLLAGWWALHIPYDPDRLLSAIPPDAVFISRHYRLADRWEAVTRNPVTRTLLSSCGVNGDTINKLRDDPTFRFWLNRLASDHVTVSYHPKISAHCGGWVMTSWLGGTARKLAPLLKTGQVPGVMKLETYAGRDIWRIDLPDLPHGLYATCTLTEGMLLGTLSVSPLALRKVIDTLDRGKSDYPATTPFMTADQMETTPDRAWWKLPADNGELYGQLNELTAKTVTGRIECRLPLPAMADRTLSLSPAICRLFRQDAIALATCETGLFEALTGPYENATWLRAIRDLLAEAAPDNITVGLFGDDFSGRLKGIKLPGLILTIPAPDQERTDQAIGRMLDELNARYRLGLIPRITPLGASSITAIDGTARTPYAALKLSERVGYTYCGGLLVAGSNLKTLMALSRRYNRPDSEREAPSCPWMDELAQSPAAAFIWLDLTRGAKIIRIALTAYSMQLLLNDPGGNRVKRRRIQEAKAWTDTLAPLGHCRAWLTHEQPDALSIRFSLGNAKKHP